MFEGVPDRFRSRRNVQAHSKTLGYATHSGSRAGRGTRVVAKDPPKDARPGLVLSGSTPTSVLGITY